MPISIRQCREEIEIFNSYKCKTPSKCVHSNFFVNLFLYKLITFILCATFMSFYLDYCNFMCNFHEFLFRLL